MGRQSRDIECFVDEYGQPEGLRPVDIVYVASDCANMYEGKSKAPAAFQKAKLRERLRAVGVPVMEQSEVLGKDISWSSRDSAYSPAQVRDEERNVNLNAAVRIVVGINCFRSFPWKSRLYPPHFQLVISGDSFMLPGILSGLHTSIYANMKLGLIYISAEAHLYESYEPKSSGDLNSTTLTHLFNLESALPSMEEFQPRLRDGSLCCDGRLVLFGIDQLRSRPGDIRTLQEMGAHIIDPRDPAISPEEHAVYVMHYFTTIGVRAFHVHLDVTAIDSKDFPLFNLDDLRGGGSRHPIPNHAGSNNTALRFETIMRALRVFVQRENAAGLSIADFNPLRDDYKLSLTRKLAMHVAAMLGDKPVRCARLDTDTDLL